MTREEITKLARELNKKNVGLSITYNNVDLYEIVPLSFGMKFTRNIESDDTDNIMINLVEEDFFVNVSYSPDDKEFEGLLEVIEEGIASERYEIKPFAISRG